MFNGYKTTWVGHKAEDKRQTRGTLPLKKAEDRTDSHTHDTTNQTAHARHPHPL